MLLRSAVTTVVGRNLTSVLTWLDVFIQRTEKTQDHKTAFYYGTFASRHKETPFTESLCVIHFILRHCAFVLLLLAIHITGKLILQLYDLLYDMSFYVDVFNVNIWNSAWSFKHITQEILTCDATMVVCCLFHQSTASGQKAKWRKLGEKVLMGQLVSFDCFTGLAHWPHLNPLAVFHKARSRHPLPFHSNFTGWNKHWKSQSNAHHFLFEFFSLLTLIKAAMSFPGVCLSPPK